MAGLWELFPLRRAMTQATFGFIPNYTGDFTGKKRGLSREGQGLSCVFLEAKKRRNTDWGQTRDGTNDISIKYH